jgi:hypothetical protein
MNVAWCLLFTTLHIALLHIYACPVVHFLKIRKINRNEYIVMKFSTSSLRMFGKPRRNAFGLGSALIVAGIGVAFIAASYAFLRDDIQSRNWPAAQAVVTIVNSRLDSDGDRIYRPTVEYSVGGLTHTTTSSSWSSSPTTVGEQRTVRYNPDNPKEGVIAMSGSDWLILIFPLLGVVIILASFAGFIVSSRRGHTIDRLKQSGTKLQGVVTNVQRSSQQGSVVITVTAQDHTGQVRSFHSDSVEGNTMALLQFNQKPIAMDVYIDPSNAEHYYVDIEDVPAMDADYISSLLKMATGQQAPTTFSTVTPQPTPPVEVNPPTIPSLPGTTSTSHAGTDSTDVPPARNYQ